MAQHLRAYVGLFLSRYALCKKTKYKQGKSHSGRCEKQFSMPAFWHPHNVRPYGTGVPQSCTSLRVLSLSVKGTLVSTQTDISPPVPAELRSSRSSMVCCWLGFAFCCLLMQTERWQRYLSYHTNVLLIIISEVEITFLSTKISPGAWAFQNSAVLSGHRLQ